MLNRSTIFEKGKPRTKVVEIPEWEDSVTIRELSAGQITKFADLAKDDKLSSARSIAASVIDETGAQVFDETDDGLAQVLTLSAAGIIRLNKAINEFNGLTEPPKN